jgi:hypothetical protein
MPISEAVTTVLDLTHHQPSDAAEIRTVSGRPSGMACLVSTPKPPAEVSFRAPEHPRRTVD